VAKYIPILLLLACDNDKKSQEIVPASPSAIAHTLGFDAAQLGGTLIDPEKPAGDLTADLATFTSVEACMKQRAASLDPLVGDAVDAIGYDTLLRDACRVLEAAKNKDPKKCELIDASALRQRCRSVTAMVLGDPDGCPLKTTSKPELGRDPTCVAAALRSPAMCAGAQKRDRPACDALLTHETKPCEGLPLDDQRVPCARDASRFRTALPGSPSLASVAAVKGTLAVHGDGRADPAQTSADLDAELGSGVVVVLAGAGHQRLAFGRFGDATPRATQPLERTRFALSFSRTPGAEDKLQIIESSLTVVGATQSSCMGDQCKLALKITKLEPKRGGALEMTVDGTLGGYRIHADIATFVRDVVTAMAP
jgi:hypothetical protein